MIEFDSIRQELDDAFPQHGGHTSTPQSDSGAEQPDDKPERVHFDERQQKRVDELIRNAMGRAGREHRDEAARLRQELEALRSQQGQQHTPQDVLLTELSTTRAELSALKQQQSEASIMGEIRKVTGAFVDGELAASILRQGVRQIDGKLVPTDQDGNPRLTADFEPMTLEDAANDLARTKPFLARSDVRSGSGSTEASHSMLSSVTDDKLSELFGKHSDPRKANALAMRDPGKYRALRSRAKERGIF
jgi:Sec-independent protein translocase protein TatA